MKHLMWILAVFITLTMAGMAGCDDSNGEGNNGGGGETPPPGKHITQQNSAQKIGDSCSCTNDGDKNVCVMTGFQVPNGGIISGCDNVPASTQGAETVCMRSSNAKGIKPILHFTNGMCSWVVAKCTGKKDGLICPFASIASENYDAFTECPAGSALIEFNMPVEVLQETATLELKACFPTCQKDEDCRIDETDPAFNYEKTQRKCVDHSGTKICADPRVLSLGK